MSDCRRIALLDEIRGFCIYCMVFYHAFYLLGLLLQLEFCMKLFRFFEPVEFLFASAFIFISGICTQFSRSVLRRGLLLLAIALTLSAISILLLPKLGYDSFQDRFGILHLLSAGMLVYAAGRKAFDRFPVLWGAVVCVILYAVTAILVPRVPVSVPWLFPLGFCTESFYSADYFPLFPHLFLFMLGTFAGRTIRSRELSDRFYRVHVHLFAWCGRYSLWIYLLHVPILLIIIQFIERI